MEVLLANPRGFCAGVDRAIEIVERALELHGAPIYVRHEVVHNKFVVDDLRHKGAVFVEDLSEVPAGATVIFQRPRRVAGGARDAEARGLKVFDATCPLVTKVHVEVAKMREAGREIVMIGHRGHPEVEGTMGQTAGGMYLVETAEDVAAPRGERPGPARLRDPDHAVGRRRGDASSRRCKARFPAIVGPKKDDICYATQNRQDAVKALARQCDVVIVVGSPNSSNSNRLREVAEQQGVPAYMVDNATRARRRMGRGQAARRRDRRRLGARGAGEGGDRPADGTGREPASRQLEGIEENVVFPLPKGLQSHPPTSVSPSD